MQLSPERSLNRHRRRASPAGGLSRLASPRSRRSPKPIEILHKCSSEPLLFPATGDVVSEDCPSFDPGGGGKFSRLQTLNDLFPYPPELGFSPLGRRNRVVGYEKDSKVLISVTVEGSPGPIRTLVKLGASVDDTIKVVIQKYVQEGRTPRLHKNASSAFDLHISYFSFQSLERSNTIGDIGSRTFYLRRSSRKGDTSAPEVVAVEHESTANHRPRPVTMVVVPSFISRKFSKIVRRMRKLFKVFGCLQSR